MAAASARATDRKPRDLRLDLARGLTMLIIFVAHVPANTWADWIPARMGFSSGAEAFVLCSGLASGLAFGGAYRRQGWQAGTGRIARRIGQLWLIQILAFAAFAGLMLCIDATLGGSLYRTRYELGAIAADPLGLLGAVAILAHVPPFFDILPLYILLLGATPFVVLLARRSPATLMALSITLWLVAQAAPFNLTANAVTGGGWYFNPLAWQLLFFIGFGVTAGWVPVPCATPPRIAIAAAVLILSFALTFHGVHALIPELRGIYEAIYPADAITTLHPLRLIHVLALGWLFAMLLAPRGDVIARPAFAPLVLVGQQALPTFIAGIFLSALAGVLLDEVGRAPGLVALVNLGGMALLVGVALVARSLKSAVRKPSAPSRTPFKEPSQCAVPR
jgi:hypothetical protein